MRGPLPFPAVIVVAVLVGPGILRRWGWVPNFVQGLSLCGIIVGTLIVHCGLLLLGYCQWMEPLQLMEISVEVGMVVYAVVLPAMLQN